MADFSVELVVLVSGVMLVASTLQGITGFGFNLLVVPVLVLFYDPKLVVPGVLMAYVPLGFAQSIQLRKLIDFRIWGSFLVSALLAMPLGAYVLKQVDAETMRTVIGALMIFLAVVLQVRPGKPFARDLLARFGTGFVSGVLATSTGVSGPPLVLLGLKQQWDYQPFRATLLAYFTGVSVLSLCVHYVMGLSNWQTVGFAGAGLPGLVLGFVLSTWLRTLIDGQQFRWVAVLMVILGGLSAIVF